LITYMLGREKSDRPLPKATLANIGVWPVRSNQINDKTLIF
jgi:hypothetical protein